MPYCSVSGIRIHYEVLGEGFPLVLIHASPCDCRLWLDPSPRSEEGPALKGGDG
ncbi:MAG: hypothetical protein QF619_05490 [Candidatus Binatia bacterium]|jgi:pimeloyl-ACP methyl ester carboxylesterase|nr:hypothetical protein [Candidatus Binatia bacterium]